MLHRKAILYHRLVHVTVSFTPTSTWCHSHCPVELCVKSLGSQGFSTSNLCRKEHGWTRFGSKWGSLDDRDLPAMHHPAWTLSSFSKSSSPRFVSRFFVLKTIQTEIQYSQGLALSQASEGKCHCLSEPVMWLRDWIQELFLSVFYRDFFYCCKLSSLWIDQVSLSPREKFTAG